MAKSPPPEIRAILGLPGFRLSGGVEHAAWDPRRDLVLLAGDRFAAVNDAASGSRLRGFSTDDPPYRLAALYEGDLIVVDANTFGRFDPRTRAGPETPVNSVAAAIADAAGVLVCLDDRGQLRTFDLRTREERAVIRGDFRWATGLALSPNGERALLFNPTEIGVVEMPPKREAWRIPHAGPAAFMGPEHVVALELGEKKGSIALRQIDARDGRESSRKSIELEDARHLSVAGAPDGRYVAIGSRRGIEVWERASGWQRAFVVPLHAWPRPFFRHDGVLLALSFGALLAWDLATKGQPLFEDAPVGDVHTILAAGETVLARGSDQRAHLWSPRTDRRSAIEAYDTDALALSPDGTRVAAYQRQQIVVRRTEDGGLVRKLGRFENVAGLAWGGHTIAAMGLSGAVHLVDARTGDRQATLPAPPKAKYRLELSPDGHRLAVGVYGQPPRLWDVPSETRLPKLDFQPLDEDGDPLSFALTLDGEQVVVGCEDGSLHRFDVATGRRLGAVPTNAVRAFVLAVSVDGRLAAMASPQETAVHVVQLADGKTIAKHAVEGRASALVFRPDGDLVVAVGSGSVQVWRLPSPARDAPLPHSIAEAPKAKTKKRPVPVRRGALPRPPARRDLRAHGELIGRLACPSGRLAVGDPHQIDDGHCIIEEAVPVGAHAVFALIGGDDLVDDAYALLVQLGEGEIVRWRSALAKGRAAGTDSARLAVADAATAAAAFEEIDGEELLSSEVLSEPLDGAIGAVIVGTTRRNAALIELGSDGGYPVLFGLDAGDRPVALAVGRDLDRLEGLVRRRRSRKS